MPGTVAKKKKYPWETKSWFVNMRRATVFRITGMDESHVYVVVHLNIPKADLALDDDEAKRDAEEFGDRAIAYTLENKVSGYLHSEHQAWKNSSPQFARSDLRPYWRLGKKVFANIPASPNPNPKTILWQDVLSEAAGIVVIVGEDSEARASAARRIAKHKKRALLELDIERDTVGDALIGPLDYALSPEHDARCVVHLNGLNRNITEPDEWGNIPAGQGALEKVVSVIQAKRHRSIVILGYHEASDVPRAIRTHENVRFLYPDSLGCTDFGAGFRDHEGKPA